MPHRAIGVCKMSWGKPKNKNKREGDYYKRYICHLQNRVVNYNKQITTQKSLSNTSLKR